MIRFGRSGGSHPPRSIRNRGPLPLSVRCVFSRAVVVTCQVTRCMHVSVLVPLLSAIEQPIRSTGDSMTASEGVRGVLQRMQGDHGHRVNFLHHPKEGKRSGPFRRALRIRAYITFDCAKEAYKKNARAEIKTVAGGSCRVLAWGKGALWTLLRARRTNDRFSGFDSPAGREAVGAAR